LFLLQQDCLQRQYIRSTDDTRQIFRDSAEQAIAALSLPLYRNVNSLEGQSFALGANWSGPPEHLEKQNQEKTSRCSGNVSAIPNCEWRWRTLTR